LNIKKRYRKILLDIYGKNHSDIFWNSKKYTETIKNLKNIKCVKKRKNMLGEFLPNLYLIDSTENNKSEYDIVNIYRYITTLLLFLLFLLLLLLFMICYDDDVIIIDIISSSKVLNI
jgi:hypothetical protein